MLLQILHHAENFHLLLAKDGSHSVIRSEEGSIERISEIVIPDVGIQPPQNFCLGQLLSFPGPNYLGQLRTQNHGLVHHFLTWGRLSSHDHLRLGVNLNLRHGAIQTLNSTSSRQGRLLFFDGDLVGIDHVEDVSVHLGGVVHHLLLSLETLVTEGTNLHEDLSNRALLFGFGFLGGLKT